MNTIGYRNPRFYQARHMPRPDPPPQAANEPRSSESNEQSSPPVTPKAPQPAAEHSENTGAKLQAAFREIFEVRAANQISTRNVLLALIERKGEPWPALWGRDIARGNLRGPAWQLARLLKPLKIAPGTIRQPNGTCKGYKLSSFDDAFPATCPKDRLENDTTSQGHE